MTALLEARNVTKAFGGGGLFKRQQETIVLEDVALFIRESPPSITGVVGESGSGKTTLIRLLLGFLSLTEGEVLYKGRNIQKMSRGERLDFRREVQVIFQDPFEVYNPFYTVDHVLTTPVTKFHFARSKSEARRLIESALEVVGLRPEETLGRYPHQLSGGQLQRIMVARACLLRPRIIFADEPVSMIDASLRAIILENLRTLNQKFGISLLYITHDLTTAYQISDNIIVLYQGSVAEIGKAELVIKNPQHPYTRLLIASIPLPDPDRKWGQDGTAVLVSKTSTKLNRGCKFVDRCSSDMPICHENPPPLFQTNGYRAVRCYLYQEDSVIAGDAMGKALGQKE